jgi:hypothetical protein
MTSEIKIRAFSGDLLNRCTNRNKRRHSLIGSTEEEVLRGFSDVFNDIDVQAQTQILKSNKECEKYPQIKCPNYPRCHEFTVKIFAHEVESGLVEDAVSSILAERGFSFIDNLVISLEKETSKRELDNIWQQMERVKNTGRVGSIGVADLNVGQLEHLVDWSSICPDIVQISPLTYDQVFEDSNSTVKKITQIGQAKNIRVTTHNDPVCCPKKLSIDLDNLLDNTGRKWKTSYTARYTQRSKDRNVVTMKGYFMGISAV